MRSTSRTLSLWVKILVVALLPIESAWAQTDADQVAAGADQNLITLNFPENLELKVLIEYVSQRLGVNILFDEQVANKRVTIKSPVKVPKDSLLGMLESALRMKGLALVDAEQPGWKRIAAATNLLAIAQPAAADREPPPTARPTLALTQVFRLEHVDTSRVEPIIKPFLSQPGGNSIPIPQQRLLIVTDYATNMPRIAELIRLADHPAGEIVMRFLPITHLDAAPLAQRVTQLLTAKLRLRGAAAAAVEGIDISHDERTNQLIIVGTPDLADEALDIINSLDVPLGLTTQVYQFQEVSPERIDRLARELIDPVAAKRLYRAVVDREAGLLVVTTTADIHREIESLKANLDVPLPAEQSPVRFYKLFNTTAAEVLETILAIEGGAGFAAVSLEGTTSPPTAGPDSPAPPGQMPGPPGYSDQIGAEPQGYMPQYPRPLLRSLQTSRATVTADANTNSIIVVAEPSVQRVYEQLIRMLDRRRPQVLVEVIIVTLDTSSGFSLGVEISRGEDFSDDRVLTFSSFGLSEVDATTGRLSLVPGLGFNGALISADIADIVIRALKTSGRSRVVSAPRILVNDNATGTIASINEAPFTSVNASDTVATTSFGGFVSAGTTITVTPHISEGDHLQLEYSISLNSFTGQGAEGIPPPRQTNSIDSIVTIPDGHTIIVGGLNREDVTETKESIPILGDIPLLEYLFSSRDQNESQTTLFVFIRPLILRNDQFEGLKYLSERDLALAGLAGDYPVSQPLAIY